jgi:hypothetical protein
MSGGVRRAAEGDLLVMVGGADSAVQRVQPVLEAMAGHAPVVGPAPWDGQKVKLVNQLLCGVHIAAAAEALAYAEALGLDAAATWQVIREGAAASFMLNDRGERIGPTADEVKSALDIFVKIWGSSSMPGARPVPITPRIRRRTVIPRRTPRRARPSRRLLGAGASDDRPLTSKPGGGKRRRSRTVRPGLLNDGRRAHHCTGNEGGIAPLHTRCT